MSSLPTHILMYKTGLQLSSKVCYTKREFKYNKKNQNISNVKLLNVIYMLQNINISADRHIRFIYIKLKLKRDMTVSFNDLTPSL